VFPHARERLNLLQRTGRVYERAGREQLELKTLKAHAVWRQLTGYALRMHDIPFGMTLTYTCCSY